MLTVAIHQIDPTGARRRSLRNLWEARDHVDARTRPRYGGDLRRVAWRGTLPGWIRARVRSQLPSNKIATRPGRARKPGRGPAGRAAGTSRQERRPDGAAMTPGRVPFESRVTAGWTSPRLPRPAVLRAVVDRPTAAPARPPARDASRGGPRTPDRPEERPDPARLATGAVRPPGLGLVGAESARRPDTRPPRVGSQDAASGSPVAAGRSTNTARIPPSSSSTVAAGAASRKPPVSVSSPLLPFSRTPTVRRCGRSSV